MPIEIRELHIKAIVNQEDQQNGTRPSRRGSPVDQSKLVAECLEKVLEILRRKKER